MSADNQPATAPGGVTATYNFTSARITDTAQRWIFRLILVGFALTWVSQQIAQLTSIDALQRSADYIWYSLLLDKTALSGEPWRLVTSMFLHAGWVHLFMNLMCMSVFYKDMKAQLAHQGWLVVFFAAGIAGSLGQLYLVPDGQAVGASGGIMGLWGAAIAAAMRFKRVPQDERPWEVQIPLKKLLTYLVIQIVAESLMANVGHGAHAFGFLTGLGLGAILPLLQQPRILASNAEAFRFSNIKVGRIRKHAKVRGFSMSLVERRVQSLTIGTTAAYQPGVDFLVVENDEVNWVNHRHISFEPLLGAVPTDVVGKPMVEFATSNSLHGRDLHNMSDEDVSSLSSPCEPDPK